MLNFCTRSIFDNYFSKSFHLIACYNRLLLIQQIDPGWVLNAAAKSSLIRVPSKNSRRYVGALSSFGFYFEAAAPALYSGKCGIEVSLEGCQVRCLRKRLGACDIQNCDHYEPPSLWSIGTYKKHSQDPVCD